MKEISNDDKLLILEALNMLIEDLDNNDDWVMMDFKKELEKLYNKLEK